jgi:hypothetical protein
MGRHARPAHVVPQRYNDAKTLTTASGIWLSHHRYGACATRSGGFEGWPGLGLGSNAVVTRNCRCATGAAFRPTAFVSGKCLMRTFASSFPFKVA